MHSGFADEVVRFPWIVLQVVEFLGAVVVFDEAVIIGDHRMSFRIQAAENIGSEGGLVMQQGCEAAAVPMSWWGPVA